MALRVFSALAVLVAIALAAPHTNSHFPNHNLNSIIDIVEAYNETLAKEFYVTDIKHLAQGSGRCGAKFFCKAHDVLDKHYNATNPNHKEDKKIVRHLEMYLIHKNCTKVLKNVTPTADKIQLPQFLKYIVECVQCRNLIVSNPSCGE